LLWQALGTRRRDLAAASVLYSTHQLGESMVPVIIGATITHAVRHGSWTSIVTWLLILAADFAFLSISFRFGARASMRAKQHVAHRVRMWLTDRVVEPAGGVRNTPGDLLSRAGSDATRVGAFAGVFASAVAAVVVLVVATVVLLRFSLLLGAVILVGTVVLLVVQNQVSGALQRRSAVEQHEQARATALAEDVVRGLRVLKGIGAEQAAAAEYAQVSRGAARAALHATSSGAVVASVGAVLSGAYLTVIAGVGGWLALSGHLGLGEFVSALGLASFVVGPMTVVSATSAAYARALASAARVQEVLAAEPGVRDPAAGAATAVADVPDVRLVGVRAATSTVTAALPAGELTGLVCPDPATAAAVPALLAREYDAAAGQILLDGSDITELPLDVLRGRVLVSPHDAVLLPGSIAENIAAVADEPVGPAAHAAFADQVIDAVPGGAEAHVGDRGETLSGGQRQRIALARALAAHAPVLVLHDPTTAVDAATEDRIAARTAELRAGRTTLVVTTSPAWLSRCDQVVHLTGTSCSVGTHAELLADAAYRGVVSR